MSDLNWFVIHAQPRREAFVRDRIGDLGREAFLPLIAERRPGWRKRRSSPLFPGYLFARLSETNGDLARVRWTQGVHRVLGDSARARPVPDEVVATIRSTADRQGKVRFGRGLKRGERVRILDGPLTGLIGFLERPAARPEERVWILVELFRRVTKVDVRSDEITPAS